MKRQFCIGTAATMLCLSQLSNIGVAKALPTCTDVSQGCLKINLEALQIPFKDIVPDGQNVQLVRDGSKLGASDLPTISKQINQRIENLWELEVPQSSVGNLDVKYHYNDLSHSLPNSPAIKLTSIVPIPPFKVRDGSKEGTVVVQGGAIFNFDLSNIKASGNYFGNLQIRVTDNQK
ncbi:MAG TPA: hypothetical protein V6D25_05730 [Leptolyngbyaceae cyanobacterium]